MYKYINTNRRIPYHLRNKSKNNSKIRNNNNNNIDNEVPDYDMFADCHQPINRNDIFNNNCIKNKPKT